jgi:pyroglutamyl-peptidase
MRVATNAADPGGARTTVLITGFGPFPGVPVNATMRLVPELAARATRAFAGIRIATAILPTEWLAAPQRLDQLLGEVRPDLALHFGVSGRARGFEVEMRACNRCATSPDASGALPPAATVRDGDAVQLRAGLPVQYLVARLRRRGIPAFVSRDAGDYLCNATLYHSLTRAREATGRRVGFIHVPATLARPGGENRGRCGACALTWEQVIEGGLEVLAACLGRRAARIMPLR